MRKQNLYHYLWYVYSFKSSSHKHQLMVFHWSLSDSKFPLFFTTLLSILADLNHAIVWVVSIYPLISILPIPLPILGWLPSATITITFMFQSFFNFRARSRYLSLFCLTSVLSDSQPQVLCWLSLGLVVIKWSVWISKSKRIFCVSYSRTDSKLCIYHLFAWSNLNFLYSSQWLPFPTQSTIILPLSSL